MNRDRALEELKARLTDDKRLQHSIAVEAIMRKLAKHLHAEIEIWGLTGLLHDIDLDIVEGDLNRHGLVAAEILEGLSVDPTVIYSIKTHNPRLGYQRRRKLDKALYCCDHLPRLIEKCALSVPGKSISGLDSDYLVQKFNEDGFFNEPDKEQIATCSELGLTLKEFFDIGLDAMKEIEYKLG
ncbi:MAG: HDIG domain-containing protein [Clostridiaceae bacterium]|nr:HDIG domain-containing protein [Clostridiaceae bacterium]